MNFWDKTRRFIQTDTKANKTVLVIITFKIIDSEFKAFKRRFEFKKQDVYIYSDNRIV